ncbi:MAG: sulfate adenylyltransferase subunit CysN [Micavibrio sp.]
MLAKTIHSEKLSEEPVSRLKERNILRFITCGSVDDGKSTLIGRMLYEAKVIFEDQFASLGSDSKKFGTVEGDLDFALLVDGLSAEREQGITIDVAYRYFSTDKRKFIVADTPGHEQYTRNMATGASTADLAVLMIDSLKGIREQTRRHSLIVSLLGVQHIVLAINKMDLVNYSRNSFEKLESEYRELAKNLGFKTMQAIPLSALKGDNITHLSLNTPWYQGPSLFNYLETVKITDDIQVSAPFRMPVQWVNRPTADFRGFAGQISCGEISVGQDIIILPSGKKSKVAQLVTYDGNLNRAGAGQSVTLTFQDEIDISRGDVIACANDPCDVADIFKAKILWMSEKEMVVGRQYTFRSATVSAISTLNELENRINVNTYEYLPAKAMVLNEIGACSLSLDRYIAFEPYAQNRDLGSFILIDRTTNETVAMGMIDHTMRRSRNVQIQKLSINREARASIKGQKPCVVWMTGLSGAGKSTVADMVEKRLWASGRHTVILDGDNIRRGLSKDLSFTEQGRVENIRRAAEVSKLMSDAGLITIVSFISPFRAEREMAKSIIGEDIFVEVFVDAPLDVAEARDVKGLYKKARSGEIPNFTGIGSPYEAPELPDIRLDTTGQDAETHAGTIIKYLVEKGFIGPEHN